MARNSVRSTVFRLLSQKSRYRFDEDGLIRDTQHEHPKALPSTVLRYRNQYIEHRDSAPPAPKGAGWTVKARERA